MRLCKFMGFEVKVEDHPWFERSQELQRNLTETLESHFNQLAKEGWRASLDNGISPRPKDVSPDVSPK